MSQLPRYESYKYSGVQWLGEIPSHWDTTVLKFECDVRDGTHDTPEYVNFDENTYPLITSKDLVTGDISFENLKYISQEDFTQISRRSKVDFGDLLMPMIGTVGGAVLVKTKELIAIKNVALFKPTKVSAKWLKYFLDSELTKIQFDLQKTGGVQSFVSLGTLRNLRLLKVPLDEQKIIADFLDKRLAQVNALIAKQETLLEKLAEQRVALISHAVTKGLNPHVEMKESDVVLLGNIPNTWNVKRLKFLLSEKLKYGANESAESEDKENPRYIRITDIDDSGNLKDETFKSLESEKAQEYLLDDLDILLARSGATVGKSYLYKAESVGIACYAGYLIRARLDQENYNPEFVNYFLQSKQYWDWISSINIQATIQNVSAEKYNDLTLAIPPLEEQKQLIEYLKNEDEKFNRAIGKGKKLVHLLNEYRSTLITQVVTGKIDVRNLKVN